jgi:hypothetical protein
MAAKLLSTILVTEHLRVAIAMRIFINSTGRPGFEHWFFAMTRAAKYARITSGIKLVKGIEEPPRRGIALTDFEKGIDPHRDRANDLSGYQGAKIAKASKPGCPLETTSERPMAKSPK